MLTEPLFTRSVVGAGRELAKDKYLAFVLCVVLILVYIRTSDQVMQQLLLTAVGAFLGLMRASTQNLASGEGSTVKTAPK